MLKLQNLRPGEKVEVVLRRHWIIYIFLGIYLFVAIDVTTFFHYFLGISPFMILISVCFWMLFSIFLYIKWLNHELDLFVITNNRVIGIEQLSFLDRTVSECNLGQVQEVNARTKGLLANLLNYGDVIIQTAGNSSDFNMMFAPDAMQNSRKILNLVDHYRDFENKGINKVVSDIVEAKK